MPSFVYIQRIIKYLSLAALAFFSFLMLQIILRYVTFNTDVAFLQIKQDYINNHFWLGAFYIHVFSSLIALLAGFTQFSHVIRTRHPSIHRFVGRIYVFDILCITGPAGFIMAFYANGGLTSRLAFACYQYCGGVLLLKPCNMRGRMILQSTVRLSCAVLH